jgi:hypothetical protein
MFGVKRCAKIFCRADSAGKNKKSKPSRDGCGDGVCSAAENFNGALVAPDKVPSRQPETFRRAQRQQKGRSLPILA